MNFIKELNKKDKILAFFIFAILIIVALFSVMGSVKKSGNRVENVQAVSWVGRVNSIMTYGRLRLDLFGDYQYPEFVAEPKGIDENRQSLITKNIKTGDIIRVNGELTIVDNQPWVIIRSIIKITEKKPLIYFGDVEEKCPWYVPDGFTYRECLSDLLDEQERAVKEQLDVLIENLKKRGEENDGLSSIEMSADIEILREYKASWDLYKIGPTQIPTSQEFMLN